MPRELLLLYKPMVSGKTLLRFVSLIPVAPLYCSMEEHDPIPAIVRDYDLDKDGEAKPPQTNGRPDVSRSDKILSQPYDSVSHRRGWGDTGYRIQVVKHDCPADHCSFDRMVRRVDVNAERRNEVRYWCLNPNCVHYAADVVSYACSGSYPSRKTDMPAVFEPAD